MTTEVVLAEGARIFGVTLVGVSTTTAVKLAFTVGLIFIVFVVRGLALGITRRILGGEVADPRRFWTRQGSRSSSR